MQSRNNIGRGRTNAFGVYIGHKICHRVPATSATLLSRPTITMSEGPKDQKKPMSCLEAGHILSNGRKITIFCFSSAAMSVKSEIPAILRR